MHNVSEGRQFVAEQLSTRDVNPTRLLSLGVQYRISDIFLVGFMRLAGSPPDLENAAVRSHLNALPISVYNDIVAAWRDNLRVRTSIIERDTAVCPAPCCVYGCTRRPLGSCLPRMQRVYEEVARPLLLGKVHASYVYQALSDAIYEDAIICETCGIYYEELYLAGLVKEITISREAAKAALRSRKGGDSVQWDE